MSHFIIQNHTYKDNSVTESLEIIEDKILKKKSKMTMLWRNVVLKLNLSKSL